MHSLEPGTHDLHHEGQALTVHALFAVTPQERHQLGDLARRQAVLLHDLARVLREQLGLYRHLAGGRPVQVVVQVAGKAEVHDEE